MRQRITIAIVDDDDLVREALAELMVSLNYSVVTFSRARDFLNSSHRHTANCLITDVQMPDMSGLDLYDRLVEAGETLPTIMITGRPDDRTSARACEAGVKFFMAKPFNERELIDSIHAALEPQAVGHS